MALVVYVRKLLIAKRGWCSPEMKRRRVENVLQWVLMQYHYCEQNPESIFLLDWCFASKPDSQKVFILHVAHFVMFRLTNSDIV